MHRIFTFGVFVLLTATAALAAPEAVRFDAQRARIHKAGAAGGLTTPSKAAPERVVAEFLATQNRDQRTLRSLVTTGSAPGRSGATHVRIGQRVAGLSVHGAYAKAAFDRRGSLFHLIDNLAAVPASGLAPARVGERAALSAALAQLYPGLRPALAEARRDGDGAEFSGGRFFYRNPTVTRVAVLMTDGSMQTGFEVETWSRKRNLLHVSLVGGDGRVLAVELRTQSDSYNVFTEDPDKGAQTVVAGPGAGNAESPIGWLGAGAQTTINIAGNNANAYLDTDADNVADPGGTPVGDGNFLTAADLTQSPAAAGNRAVAVQNLFYFNNVLHDVLYSHGFDEAAGNFQEDNFGLAGLGGDSVNAEAQDGSGTDNANFATPSDGSNPRMQMFLWSPVGTHELVVNSPSGIAGSYAAGGAAFGPTLTFGGVTGDVVLAVDNRGAANDACDHVTNKAQLTGRIALVDRGTCTFLQKAGNVQTAGAIAMIVVNNAGDDVFIMGGSGRRITIPSELIGQSDGTAIKAALGGGVNATLRLVSPAPPQHDSSVDADIVFHEYGHGLTWRMIGGMSGTMSGAVGEGMSDVLAVLLNGDDVVAEYSTSSPGGIRSEPFDGYSRTYGDFSGDGIHFDGEIYAAIGWRLGEIFAATSVPLDTLLDYIVDGMNFTPSGPAFEDMRDGILQSAAGSDHECLIWEAFAEFGVGVGATATVRGPNVTVTESFALPSGCP